MDVDLSVDAGELPPRVSTAAEEDLLKVASSVNVATGFQAGYPLGIYRTLRVAAESGLAVGAHPSYFDPLAKGRRPMEYAYDELFSELVYQLGAVDAVARSCGVRVSYVKPHGALYNAMFRSEDESDCVLSAVRAASGNVVLLLQAGGVGARMAEERGFRVVYEGFPDRRYRADGSLVPRSEVNAVVSEPVEVAARAIRMIEDGSVEAVGGEVVSVTCDSLCIHSDSPNAAESAAAVRSALVGAGHRIKSFV